MPDVPVVIKIADDGAHETFQISHERYLSSVKVPSRDPPKDVTSAPGD
jgi:hypothetical protein